MPAAGDIVAFEYSGVAPDAIGTAKGLGGGFPIGAMWVRKTRADLFRPGKCGSTFGGTPLACSAALAVLDVMSEEKLLERVRRQSVPWLQNLRGLRADRNGLVVDVRGQGYLVGLQLSRDPAPYLADLRARGFLAPMAGGNVIRLLPPLNVTEEDLAESVELLRQSLSAVR